MVVLGIDTATRTASVALTEHGEVVAEQSRAAASRLGASFFPLVEEVLTAAGRSAADLDAVAVSIGPGSFTGLRVGLSVAKGLAISTNCSVVGVSTLEALARVALPVADAGQTIWPVLDARKGEVYTASFRRGDSPSGGDSVARLSEDRAAPAAEVAAAIEGSCVLLGDGVEAYREVWDGLADGTRALPFADFHPSGSVVAALGAERLAAGASESVDALAPRYCRKSEAEVNLQARPAP